MQPNTIKMPTDLLHVLAKDSHISFTVKEIKTEFLRTSTTPMCPNLARRFVYKQLVRLVKLKLLSRNGTKFSRQLRYKKTKLFSQVNFIESCASPKLIGNKDDNVRCIKNNTLIKKQLELEIKECQIAMTIAVAESDEYKRLIKTFPHIKRKLKKQYSTTREKHSQLLGKVNALNNTLLTIV